MAYDTEIAAMTVFCEASSQDQQTRLAVAFSEVNRLKTGRFGGTLAEVCLRRKAYSEWNGDKVDNDNLLRAARCTDSDETLEACEDAVYQAMHGTSADPTGGATHYYDTSIAAPDWTAAPAVFAGQFGNLRFYRGVA